MNTDAIERLRRFLRDHGDNSASMCLLGPDDARAILDRIAALTAERDAAQNEVLEQARLLGMGGEREARLIAERDAAVAEVVQIVAWLRLPPWHNMALARRLHMAALCILWPEKVCGAFARLFARLIAAGAHKESGHVAED